MSLEIIEKEGRKFAVIPFSTYARLISDAEMLYDLELYREGLKDEGESMPAEVVHAIVDGANPVRVYREYRELTQQQLADKAGVSRPYIAEIESGKKKGGVTSLKAIAKALKVDLDDIC